MTVIQPGDTILVTGATGYVGSHVVEELIAAGFKVRATSRAIKKAQFLIDLIGNKFGQNHLEVFEVPDMVAEDAYDEAVNGVTGVVYLATVVSFSAVPEEVIPVAVKGTLGLIFLNIFKSATKSPTIKSLVVTSSSSAVLIPTPNQHTVVTEATWNDISVAKARTSPSPNAYDVYAASKAEAERALWQAVQEMRPSFQVSTILPGTNFGTRFRETGNSSCELLLGAYTGKNKVLQHVPPQYFVDVSDSAKFHVAALRDPSCDGARIFAWAAPFNYNDILDVFRRLEPEGDWGDDVDVGRDLTEAEGRARAEELLVKHYGHGFTSLEESVKRAVGPVGA